MTQSPQVQAQPRRALRVRDFCSSFGISEATAYRLMRRGQLSSVKVGGSRLIPIEAAEALLKAKAA